MRFEKFLKEDAAQLAITGMASKRPHVFGDNNPDSVSGKQCPPDEIWDEKQQKCVSTKPSSFSHKGGVE